jgi:FkbM family methyltransferase
MSLLLKKKIRSLLNQVGWDIHRYRAASDPWALIFDRIQHHRINVVLDVGANAGQFASELRSHGYRDQIISFEPLSLAHANLKKNAAGDPAWTVAPRGAIGSTNGEVMINISKNSVSSSLLPINEALVRSAPEASYECSEPTPLDTLDRAAGSLINSDSRAFLKIDTQGFESEVLNGAVETLKRTAVICVETSLVPLYGGQPLWRSIVERLESDGWVLWDIQHAFSDPITGQLLQADLVFSRPIASA